MLWTSNHLSSNLPSPHSHSKQQKRMMTEESMMTVHDRQEEEHDVGMRTSNKMSMKLVWALILSMCILSLVNHSRNVNYTVKFINYNFGYDVTNVTRTTLAATNSMQRMVLYKNINGSSFDESLLIPKLGLQLQPLKSDETATAEVTTKIASNVSIDGGSSIVSSLRNISAMAPVEATLAEAAATVADESHSSSAVSASPLETISSNATSSASYDINQTDNDNDDNVIIRHVQKLVSQANVSYPGECLIELLVSNPYERPHSFRLAGLKDKVGRWWQTAYKDYVFGDNKNRTLPGNVTIGVGRGDYSDPIKEGYRSFASSSPGGDFAVPNFLEILRFTLQDEEEPYVPKPWEERVKIPTFRGTLWNKVGQRGRDDDKGATFANQTDILSVIAQSFDPRGRVTLTKFSRDHPDLVDARIPSKAGLHDGLWKYNATNGLHKLLPFDPIPRDVYYTNYQVVVVMAGIGAAFRTPLHLSTGTAVILQSYQMEEWFVQYMQPWVHYIPLDFDLSNLEEILLWVKQNPAKLREIAGNGKEFYDKYLSLNATEDFLYRLAYGLALKKLQIQQQQEQEVLQQ